MRCVGLLSPAGGAAPRRGRLRPAAGAGAVALGLLAVGGCGGGSPGARPAGPPPTPAAACGPVAREPLDPGSTRHVLPGAPEPAYASDPPTSGPHLAGGAVQGVRAEPLPRPVQVAVLEEGGVVVHHRGLSEADRRAVEALAGDDVVVAPHPGLTAPVVATAWGHRLTCGRVDVDALRAFVADRRGRGPAH